MSFGSTAPGIHSGGLSQIFEGNIMNITDRDMQVLLCLARHHLLNRFQIQRLCFPADKDGRVARRRLAALTEEGLIRKHYIQIVSQYDKPAGAIYLLTPCGCRFLADKKGMKDYLFKPVNLPHALYLSHQLAVAEFHMILDSAISGQSQVTLEAWHNEFDIINSGEPDTKKHYRLFTEIQAWPRLVCAPDAAFMLARHGTHFIFYVELDRGERNRGTNAKNIVLHKNRGYRELARLGLHRRHFPGTNAEGFSVLLIAPNASRRDAICRAFGKKDPHLYRTDLWQFASLKDISSENMLQSEIFYRCHNAELPEKLLP
jgi:hypothetical protein